MADITIRLYIGPSSSDLRELIVPTERPLGDLIIDWKKVYHLAEQDSQGEMIRYQLYRESEGKKVSVDPKKSLRDLRFQAYQELFLTDARHPWWQGANPQPSTTSQAKPPGTAPLRGPATSKHPTATTAPNPISRPLPSFSPCSIELAPGCVRQIGETGVVINRDYLLHELPKSVSTLERTLMWMRQESRLLAVSRSEKGHCSIVWKQSWYLMAHHPIYISGNKYSRNEAIQIEETVTLLLGRDGWPITLRLHSTSIIPIASEVSALSLCREQRSIPIPLRS